MEDIAAIITAIDDFLKKVDEKVGKFLNDINKDIEKLNNAINNEVGKSQKAVTKEIEKINKKIREKETAAEKWVDDQCKAVEDWAAEQVKSIQKTLKEEKAQKLAQTMSTAGEKDVDPKLVEQAMSMIPDTPIPIPSVPRPAIPWPEIPTAAILDLVDTAAAMVPQAPSLQEVGLDQISATETANNLKNEGNNIAKDTIKDLI